MKRRDIWSLSWRASCELVVNCVLAGEMVVIVGGGGRFLRRSSFDRFPGVQLWRFHFWNVVVRQISPRKVMELLELVSVGDREIERN